VRLLLLKFDDADIQAGKVVLIDFNFSITKADGSVVTESIHQAELEIKYPHPSGA
jgi:hypothetical protein